MSAQQRVPGRRAWGRFLLVALIALAAQRLFMGRHMGFYDEGLMLTAAQQVSTGWLPYREFYFTYGLASLYLLAGAFKVFGANLMVERWLDLAVKACLVAMLHTLGCRVSTRFRARIVALAASAWLIGLGGYGSPVWEAAALACAMLLLLQLRGFCAALLAGLVAGLNFTFRPETALASAGAAGMVLLWQAFAAQPDERSYRFGRTVIFGAGFAGCAASYIAILWQYGMLPDVQMQIVEFGLRIYPQYRALPWPHSVDEDLAFYAPLAALALWAAAERSWSSPRCADKGDDQDLRWTVRFIAAQVAVLFLKGMVRKSVSLVAPALLLALVLAAACLGPALRSRGPSGKADVRAWAGHLLLLLLVVPSAIITVNAIGQSALMPHLQRLIPTLPGSRAAERVEGGIAMSADQARVVAFIERHAAPSQPIFIGAGRHDKIFVNDAAFYFMAKRSPATKWFIFDPGMQTSGPVQGEMVNDLDRTRPPVIILNTAYDEIREPNRSAASSGVRLLDDYIAKHYQEVERFGTFRGLLRKPG